ncbi:MAG: hypothetical protein ACKVQW_09815 [Pyrinomonadaceae bacterium]
MAQARFQNSSVSGKQSSNLIVPILALWGVVLIALFTYLAYEIGADQEGKFYLLPWTFLTGGVLVAPAVFFLYKGKFDPFHPLIFPTWSYFLPAFFVGGLLLSFGLVEPYYLAYVEDERFNLPLTLIYVVAGYLGLIAGFALPIGRKFGEMVSRRLPTWDWPTENIPIPGLILLAIGLGNTILAFTMGILGFQKVDERGLFDGIIFLFSLFFAQATLLLWLYVFRHKTFGFIQIAVIATVLITSLGRSVFQGNRGMFLNTFIMIAFAFILSGRKITFRTGSLGSAIIFVAVVFGMIYGTTFRSIKQDQSVIDMDKYADVVASTFEQVGTKDINDSLTLGFVSLGERLESVSSLAVIVSNYERLAPYEELYGIDNNIWKDTTIFFIPRLVWPDKPVAIEPTKYADLYFNYSENSFAVTPMGDLLRNFGPFGVPAGMIFLGFLLRFIYATLQENQVFSYWRATLYYMILTAISYEGTYSLIVPLIFKVGVIAVVGILILRIFAGPGRKREVVS